MAERRAVTPQLRRGKSTAALTGNAGSTEPAAAAAMSDFCLIRQAMAFRVKYRVWKKRVPLNLLGVHKLNRGGVYPQAETVQNLALKILDGGFCVEEANHEGVCVQELPPDQRDSEPVPTSTQLRRYETYK